MPESPQAYNKDNQGGSGNGEPHPKVSRRVRFGRLIRLSVIILIVLACIAAVGGLIVASLFFKEPSDRAKFLTESFLALFVLVAIIVQTVIYFSQRDLMRKQWEEMCGQSAKMSDALMLGNRASVSVHSIAINQAQRAVLVKIENTGNMPAEHISLFFRLVSFSTVKWIEGGDPSQTVKTDSVREHYGRTKLFKGNLPILLTFYFTRWTDKEIRLIGDGAYGLVVLGYVDYRDGFSTEKRTEFFFNYQSELDVWTAGSPDYGDFIGYEESPEQG